jgi:hypothetical protein
MQNAMLQRYDVTRMKLLVAPKVPGETEASGFDSAFHMLLNASKAKTQDQWTLCLT